MKNRTKGAVVVGLALVGSALVLGYNTKPVVPANSQGATVLKASPTFLETSPLRQHIPITDSNDDGVPDWQELLHNTKPLAVASSSEAFKASDTLTEQFALDFFETYMRNRGLGPLSRPPEDLVNQATQSLVTKVQDTLYTKKDITTYPGTASDVTEYINAVATIIDSTQLPTGSRNELAIIEEAVNTNDSAVLSELAPIIENYDVIVTGLQKLEVPEIMATEHLDFLNATQAVRNDIFYLRQLFIDPVKALLHLNRYQDDVLGLGYAFVNLFETANQLGSGFASDDPVHAVYKF